MLKASVSEERKGKCERAQQKERLLGWVKVNVAPVRWPLCAERMAAKCYYNILGIEKKANPAEIKAAYRAMAMEFHPDRSSSIPLLPPHSALWRRLPRGTASEHEILAGNHLVKPAANCSQC